MTPERLAEIEALAPTTLGPLMVVHFEDSPSSALCGLSDVYAPSGQLTVAADKSVVFRRGDARYLAMAWTAVPELTAAIRERDATLADLRKDIADHVAFDRIHEEASAQRDAEIAAKDAEIRRVSAEGVQWWGGFEDGRAAFGAAHVAQIAAKDEEIARLRQALTKVHEISPAFAYLAKATPDRVTRNVFESAISKLRAIVAEALR